MFKLLKISTWVSIIESRLLHNKYSSTLWYKERIKICNSCIYNSLKSKPKTIKEKVYRFLNLYTYFCLACGCSIKYKAVKPASVCGLEEIGEDPKWKSIYIPNKKTKDGTNTKRK